MASFCLLQHIYHYLFGVGAFVIAEMLRVASLTGFAAASFVVTVALRQSRQRKRGGDRKKRSAAVSRTPSIYHTIRLSPAIALQMSLFRMQEKMTSEQLQ